MERGGGDILCIDLLRDSSTCAFLECDNARLGTDGMSSEDEWSFDSVSTAVVGLLGVSKKSRSSLSWGVVGVMGDESMDELSADKLGVLRKARSIWEKSESDEPSIEPDDLFFRVGMSGAFNAWTFVVEMSSVGREMRFRSKRPFGCLILRPRDGAAGSVRLARLVKALARAMVVDAMV